MGYKGWISNLIRSTGLIYRVDTIRYYFIKLLSAKANRAFRKQNPCVLIPPDYLMYESFRLNYSKYYFGGLNAAQWLVQILSRYVDLNNKKILDWGCGPGRIIRHLPAVARYNCEYYGTDSNQLSIDWCKKSLPGITFSLNSNKAHLPFTDGFMDIIYGISVFTHLSGRKHYEWHNELTRILKPGGIMLFTTQGDNFRSKLTAEEIGKFNNGQIVTRSGTKEGHRTYSAFQPVSFMHTLFREDEIIEHIVTVPEKGKWPSQDVWIIRKKL